VHGAEVLLGDADDFGVYLHHGDLLDRGVLEHFFGRSAVAATDDEHALGSGVRGGRRVDEVLVIDELITFGCHVEAVQPEQLAVVRRVVDRELLVLGLPLADLARGLDVEPGRGI